MATAHTALRLHRSILDRLLQYPRTARINLLKPHRLLPKSLIIRQHTSQDSQTPQEDPLQCILLPQVIISNLNSLREASGVTREGLAEEDQRKDSSANSKSSLIQTHSLGAVPYRAKAVPICLIPTSNTATHTSITVTSANAKCSISSKSCRMKFHLSR